MGDQNHIISQDNSTFFKFRRLYLLAFLLIAATIIIAQILIQKHLNSQLNDSNIVNIAGRQRMLSQKLVKEVLFLANYEQKEERLSQLEIIKNDYLIFVKAHESLQNEFSELGKLLSSNADFKKLFIDVDGFHSQLIHGIDTIITEVENNPLVSKDAIQQSIQQLKLVESQFLINMNAIV